MRETHGHNAGAFAPFCFFSAVGCRALSHQNHAPKSPAWYFGHSAAQAFFPAAGAAQQAIAAHRTKAVPGAICLRLGALRGRFPHAQRCARKLSARHNGAGFVGEQIVAPRSIRACAKSPRGHGGGQQTRSPTALKTVGWPPAANSATANSRDPTRSTLPFDRHRSINRMQSTPRRRPV